MKVKKMNYRIFLQPLLVTFLALAAHAASKSKPAPENPGLIFEKISPHLKAQAQVEDMESRYGKRLVITLTASRTYDNLKYKVDFHPHLNVLGGSPQEGHRPLAENESLVLEYIFDTRDVEEPVTAHLVAYQEMGDRHRHGISEPFEVYSPEGAEAFGSGKESYTFPAEKRKRILQ